VQDHPRPPSELCYVRLAEAHVGYAGYWRFKAQSVYLTVMTIRMLLVSMIISRIFRLLSSARVTDVFLTVNLM